MHSITTAFSNPGLVTVISAFLLGVLVSLLLIFILAFIDCLRDPEDEDEDPPSLPAEDHPNSHF